MPVLAQLLQRKPNLNCLDICTDIPDLVRSTALLPFFHLYLSSYLKRFVKLLVGILAASNGKTTHRLVSFR